MSLPAQSSLRAVLNEPASLPRLDSSPAGPAGPVREPEAACVRVALVGVSGYGRWHLMMLAEQALFARARLVGATVINQAQEIELCRRFRAHGVPLFSDYREMLATLAGEIDLVLLPTAIHCHTPMVLTALEAGLNVLVEKPVAATLQEVDQLIAARDRTGRLLAVGFQDLYVPQTHAIKHRLLAGEIGPLRRISVTVHWPRPNSYFSRNNWAGRLQTEGAWVLDSPINNACAHFLMLALFWAGPTPGGVAEVATIQAELYRIQPIESFDTVNLRLVTATGVQIDFYASHCGIEERPPAITLTGERGAICWTSERQYTLTRGNATVESHPLTDHLMTKLHVLENVIGRLRGDPGHVVEPGLAREHTRVVNAVHEHFPIHDITGESVVRVIENGTGFVRLIGIDEAIQRAAAGGHMLSETGLGWTVPSATASLNGYARFSGLWSPAGRTS